MKKVKAQYPIRVVAKKTGLSPHVIRIWERRYKAIRPQRTPSNRRLYSEEDVARLKLLGALTAYGYNIGQIAKLSKETLEGLAPPKEGAPAPWGESLLQAPREVLQGILLNCLKKITELDPEGLETSLRQASLDLNQRILLEQVIAPLVEVIGTQWEEGKIGVVHEHLASAVIRSFLDSLKTAYKPPASAPVTVVATPKGQVHELGALLASQTAAGQGWRVLYLGSNLPAEEIVTAAKKSGARLVALSVVYPEKDHQVTRELKKIRKMLPQKTAIAVGGRSAPSYREVIAEIHGNLMPDLREFRKFLETVSKAAA